MGVEKAASGELVYQGAGEMRTQGPPVIRVRKGAMLTANTIFLPYKLTEDSGCAGKPATTI